MHSKLFREKAAPPPEVFELRLIKTMQTEETVQGEVRRWLLGLLPQAESQSLEERFITDAALYEELFIIEDELIDDYLTGKLTVDERAAFESYFMNSTERQKQFRVANALRAFIDDSKQPIAKQPVIRAGVFRTPLVAVSFVVTALLIVAFVWLAFSLRAPATGGSATVVLLPSGLTREGGSVQTVTIPKGIEVLQFELRLFRKDFQKYRATLLNADGNLVQKSDGLTPTATGSPSVTLTVKAAKIPPGEYQLKLDGAGADGTFESAEGYRFVVNTEF